MNFSRYQGENEDSIDVATYFQQQYNRKLQYPFLPCVVSQSGSCFPAEVCYLEEVK